MATAVGTAEPAPRRWRLRLPERLPDLKGKWLTLYTVVWAIVFPLSLIGAGIAAYLVISTPTMKVADEQCAANALLYVAPDKAKLLADWRKSDSILWGSELTDGEIRQLVHSTEAATSWQVLAYRGSDGRGLARNRIARLSNPNEAAKVEMSPGSAIDNVGAPISRILNPLRIGFDISVLVVDGRAAGGSNLTQLADFAAMQLFARTKLQAGATQPAPTILTLLDDARTGRPAPASLTEWDLAYLRALYSYSDM